MTLSRDEEAKGMAFMRSYPGRRGGNGGIPADIHDTIYKVGNGITMALWGRPIHPRQIQHLYDSGAHTPDKIHAVFNAMQHPHAPNVTIGQYPDYVHAYKVHEEHSK